MQLMSDAPAPQMMMMIAQGADGHPTLVPAQPGGQALLYPPGMGLMNPAELGYRGVSAQDLAAHHASMQSGQQCV